MINIIGTLSLACLYLIVQIIFITLKKSLMWKDLITAAYWALVSVWWICCGTFIEPNNGIIIIGTVTLFLNFLAFFILYISAKKDIEFMKESFRH